MRLSNLWLSPFYPQVFGRWETVLHNRSLYLVNDLVISDCWRLTRSWIVLHQLTILPSSNSYTFLICVISMKSSPNGCHLCITSLDMGLKMKIQRVLKYTWSFKDWLTTMRGWENNYKLPSKSPPLIHLFLLEKFRSDKFRTNIM